MRRFGRVYVEELNLLIVQNTELYRRGFVVPLTNKAELALRNGDVDEQTEVEFVGIPDELVFYGLWEKGLFSSINLSLGVMIDDYEEAIVDNSKLGELKEVIRVFKKRARLYSEEALVVDALERLVEIALVKERVIFFIM